MQKLLARFADDESAAAAVEYLLIVATLSIVIVAVLQRFGIALNSIFMTLDQNAVITTDGS